VVTIYIINALAKNDYDVILYVNKNVQNKEIKEMIGVPIFPSVKTVVKPTMFKPKWMLEMNVNAFKSLFLKQKCDILIDTYSNFLFPWTDVCYIHFPFFNEHSFRFNFPYLKRNSLSHVVNIPHIFIAKNISRYKQKLIIVNSHFTANFVRRSLSVDPEVIFPPIAPIFFGKESTSNQMRENLVVTVARINPDKRLESIPDIARLTSDNVYFAIIGLVHNRIVYDAILKKIRKLNLIHRFKILTGLSKKDIVNTLGRAKVYLHPPITEHFGISITEAMSLGCIPIVYDSGGVKEFVPPQYRYQNLEEASRKVENAIENWSFEKSKQMKRIAQKFSGENFSEKFIKVFSKYARA
jgi:glycosyltransferase involved in cell wall biosynthesis